MQWSRVKSICLVILLLVDGFLCLNIAGKYVSRSYRQAENAHNIVEILSGQGIRVGAGFSLPDAHTLPVLQIDRSRADEDRFSFGLLGEDALRQEEQDGSGTVRYTSEAGTVSWQGGGQVTGAFVPAGYAAPSDSGEALRLARTLLTQAGLAAANLSLQADGLTVTASFPTAGVPVFNRALTLDFAADRVRLSGLWTFDTPYITKSGNYVTFAATDALFTLISREEVTQIDSLTAGFLLGESGSGRMQMTPGWRVKTNAGSFFVDSLKISSVLL